MMFLVLGIPLSMLGYMSSCSLLLSWLGLQVWSGMCPGMHIINESSNKENRSQTLTCHSKPSDSCQTLHHSLTLWHSLALHIIQLLNHMRPGFLKKIWTLLSSGKILLNSQASAQKLSFTWIPAVTFLSSSGHVPPLNSTSTACVTIVLLMCAKKWTYSSGHI